MTGFFTNVEFVEQAWLLRDTAMNTLDGFSKKTATINVWDNIDFDQDQEMQTGHGTTYHKLFDGSVELMHFYQ